MQSFTFVTLFWICYGRAQSCTADTIKEIQGTYGLNDGAGTELSRLYVCQSGADFHWSIFQNADRFGNHLVSTGRFERASIQQGQDSVIVNADCVSQSYGVYAECDSSFFDVSQLNQPPQLISISLSVTVGGKTSQFDFFKLSSDLLGNEKMDGYQCAVTWQGNLMDSYPSAFATQPFPWSANGERDIEVYLADNRGCWGWVTQNGERGPYYGNIFNRKILSDGAVHLHEWSDLGIDESDACSSGSQISVRVDKDVLLIGFQCKNGIFGDSLLLYKTDEFDSCPVVTVPQNEYYVHV